MCIYKSLIKTSRHLRMQNIGTKRRIWTIIREVPKESNEEDIGPIKNQDESGTDEEIDFLMKHADIVR